MSKSWDITYCFEFFIRCFDDKAIKIGNRKAASLEAVYDQLEAICQESPQLFRVGITMNLTGSLSGKSRHYLQLDGQLASWNFSSYEDMLVERAALESFAAKTALALETFEWKKNEGLS